MSKHVVNLVEVKRSLPPLLPKTWVNPYPESNIRSSNSRNREQPHEKIPINYHSGRLRLFNYPFPSYDKKPEIEDVVSLARNESQRFIINQSKEYKSV